ncbi:MAG: DUF6465 family protein [Lachnospiraceae bacterium]
MKTTLNIQYLGSEISEKEIIAKVKELWLNDGNKIKDIKTLTLYIKPEEMTVYYVINETITGSISFAEIPAPQEA